MASRPKTAALIGRRTDIPAMARELGVSARTLQRRLGSEGASFQLLLTAVRRARARELLADSALDIDEVAVGLRGPELVLPRLSAAGGTDSVQLACHAPEPEDLAMRVLIVGASGMVGQGVLRECLVAPDVSEVIVLGRSKIEPAPISAPARPDDLFDLTRVEPELRGSMPASSAWECLRPE
jgi:hypothetical protein